MNELNEAILFHAPKAVEDVQVGDYVTAIERLEHLIRLIKYQASRPIKPTNKGE